MTEQSGAGVRGALRTALAAKQCAEAEAVASGAALERATRLLERAEAELGQFLQVEAEASHHDVEDVKAALRAGAEASIPEMDTARAQVRVRLEARRSKATQVRDGMAKEHEAALSGVRAAETRLWQAAINVVREEASSLAAELGAAQDRMRALRVRLTAIAGLWVTAPGDRPQLIGLPPAVVGVLHRPEPQSVPRNDPRALATVQWRAFMGELLQNPEACWPPIAEQT